MNREEILNELLVLSKKQEELWKYHPSNPNKVNVENDYRVIKQSIKELERKLK